MRSFNYNHFYLTLSQQATAKSNISKLSDEVYVFFFEETRQTGKFCD